MRITFEVAGLGTHAGRRWVFDRWDYPKRGEHYLRNSRPGPNDKDVLVATVLGTLCKKLILKLVPAENRWPQSMRVLVGPRSCLTEYAEYRRQRGYGLTNDGDSWPAAKARFVREKQDESNKLLRRLGIIE